MLLPVLAFGLGGLALWLTRESGAPVSPAPSYEFAPEVVKHSPEFLAREARKMEAGPRTILFLGDSLTASDYWKKITLPGATLRGKGWAGKQAKVVLDNSAPLLTEVNPTDVVFLAGVNNVASGQSAERVEKDLMTAWATFKARGAKVWAVQMTPWYGYKFFTDAKKAPTLRAVTAAVNAFMLSKQGQPDGPDYVIDTSAMGDADRKLLKAYSHDGLHMNGKGYTALAMVVQNALTTTPTAAVGADPIGPALQLVIDGLRAKMERSGVPPVDVELDWRTVTFIFNDVTAESVVKAGELLPSSQEIGSKRYFFATRTKGRNVAVGAEIPAEVQRAIELFTDRLTRNDAAPVGVEYTVDPQTRYRYATFTFYTGFREARAAEILPSGYKTGAQMLYLKTRVLPEAEIGQVVGTEQSTPWTCGPAALRAVLAHHGDDVSEDRVAVLAGNVPVLGVRPDGLVKAARDLGYLVNATVLHGVASLAPFLANDLPVLVVVDSWTHPGRAGHWVVVTALEGGNIRLMDPHTPGNWRVLPRSEFDARWWHREQGRVVRRFAIIVAPEGRVAVGNDLPDTDWIFEVEYLKQVWPLIESSRANTATLRKALKLATALDSNVTFTQQGNPETVALVSDMLAWLRQNVAVGADEAKPAHGRTANLVYKGMPKWLDVLGKVQRGVTKALVTAFSGGLAAKAVDAMQSQLMSAAEKMNAKEFATWLNNATNEEIAVMRIGQLRRTVQKARDKKAKAVKLYDRLGLNAATFGGTLEEAMTATLRAELFSWDLAPMVPPQQHLHSLQALAILLYGVDALPLLDARLKAKPKAKSVDREPDQTTLLDWANVTLAVLDKYAEDRAEAPRDFA